MSGPHVHDVIGIGLGPFNLGLACLAEPTELDALFLEQRDDFSWHPGMLLPGATLQVPFLADLVSLADPTSPFSFLAHLKEEGRLYRFYIREQFAPLRAEFDRYCRWAAGRLPTVRFSRHVHSVEHDGDHYLVHSIDTRTGDRLTDRAHRLVLGTGTPPWVPDPCRELLDGVSVVHTGGYLPAREQLQHSGSITVLGSGQSAAEVYRDLLPDARRLGYQLDWVTRSPRFFPLEYTKLTLEMTSPDYVDHFHALPAGRREALLASQHGLYKGIDAALVDELYDLLYELDLDGPPPTRLITSSELQTATRDDAGGYVLGLRNTDQDRVFEHRTASLVLATGYRHTVPDFLAPVRGRLRLDDAGRFDVRRDYSVDVGGGEVFVQNAELHTHGFVAPDLGMAAYRNSCILRSLLGREVYPVERSIAFQTFGSPAREPAEALR
ncbi:SidA/IucD/PvdA family monooxygenase [Modestobacter sp. I12A-02628]|uniref:L-lysine N6-monooxygenase MbtG n=1 Tax=Goekera deserti TaxID=2497753 RepID=A0A7K3WBW4_9ACTN|nr:SidA/IucD/PvdA family monooxygenase [Goekera deserti]MPQ98231.1 SidA/IucD/PvdA family monooxygenase [Goekera deserti]NDI48057.1 SidA/IucD/PvdA family monooxygenase [Goekera deserti]NEL53806.1 SidA/IucD/PvdA family monooxygenase [Goekera deserti]